MHKESPFLHILLWLIILFLFVINVLYIYILYILYQASGNGRNFISEEQRETAMTQLSSGSSWNKLVPSTSSTKLERVGVVSILWENTAGDILSQVSVIDKKDEGDKNQYWTEKHVVQSEGDTLGGKRTESEIHANM